MSADRVVYSMVVGWVLLVGVLIVLDWLGNPNRGSFRPKGDRRIRPRGLRRVDRTRRRLEDDAAVRATLRDAYGASSMRLSWSGDKEAQVRAVDDSLVVRDLDERVGVVDVGSRELPAIDYTAIDGDPLPNLEELEPTDDDEAPPPAGPDESEAMAAAADDGDPADPDPHDQDPEDPDPGGQDPDEEDAAPDPVAERPVGWRVGVDPLALTSRGTEPAPTTIRQRVWKNFGAQPGWDDDNLERLRAGKPPRRRNPITGKDERAIVDVDTGTASWGSEPIDPFASAGETDGS